LSLGKRILEKIKRGFLSLQRILRDHCFGDISNSVVSFWVVNSLKSIPATAIGIEREQQIHLSHAVTVIAATFTGINQSYNVWLPAEGAQGFQFNEGVSVLFFALQRRQIESEGEEEKAQSY
jgi:hypothetical protein